MQEENRSIFDWVIFTFIHLVLLGGIGYAGFHVYGSRLGAWVAVSAAVAGFASCYLFAKDIPGETLMKIILGLCVAANAGYLVHNGAQQIGVNSYNAAQVEKFERGMAEAGKATSRRIAKELRLGAESASKIELAFGDGVALIAAILAFAELASALVIFAIASKRGQQQKQASRQPLTEPRRSGEFDDVEEIEVRPTSHLEGKDHRR